MNKKMIKKYLMLIVIILNLVGCNNKSFINPKSNYITFEDVKYYTSGTEYSLGEYFEIYPKDMKLKFKINDIKITKKTNNIPNISTLSPNSFVDENGDFNFKIDSKANFLDNHNYIIISGEISNIGSNNAFIDYMFSLYDRDKENYLLPIFTGNTETNIKKDEFIISSLKPNETFDFTLIYIVTDENVVRYENSSILAIAFGSINNPVIEFVKIY